MNTPPTIRILTMAEAIAERESGIPPEPTNIIIPENKINAPFWIGENVIDQPITIPENAIES